MCPPAADLVTTDSYKCDEATCKAPDCQCPRNSPPGGLTADQIPQFVLVSERLRAPLACVHRPLPRGAGAGAPNGRGPRARARRLPASPPAPAPPPHR